MKLVQALPGTGMLPLITHHAFINIYQGPPQFSETKAVKAETHQEVVVDEGVRGAAPPVKQDVERGVQHALQVAHAPRCTRASGREDSILRSKIAMKPTCRQHPSGEGGAVHQNMAHHLRGKSVAKNHAEEHRQGGRGGSVHQEWANNRWLRSSPGPWLQRLRVPCPCLKDRPGPEDTIERHPEFNIEVQVSGRASGGLHWLAQSSILSGPITARWLRLHNLQIA